MKSISKMRAGTSKLSNLVLVSTVWLAAVFCIASCNKDAGIKADVLPETETDIASLTLKYNRARQGSITQELTEIIAGAEAIS